MRDGVYSRRDSDRAKLLYAFALHTCKGIETRRRGYRDEDGEHKINARTDKQAETTTERRIDRVYLQQL
jgi:hypothetical protein